MVSTVIFVYAASSPLAGYFGGSLYARFGGGLRSCYLGINSLLAPRQGLDQAGTVDSRPSPCCCQHCRLSHQLHCHILPRHACDPVHHNGSSSNFTNYSTRAYFATQVLIVSIFTFVIVPLTIVGSVLGRNISGTIELPCRVNPFPRVIPEKKWCAIAILCISFLTPH